MIFNAILDTLPGIIFVFSLRLNVHAEDDDGYTPLHRACYNGHMDCVMELYSAGADVTRGNRYGDTPIHYAAQYNHHEVVLALVDRGCDCNMVSSIVIYVSCNIIVALYYDNIIILL